MTAYYVLGISFVVLALAISALGLTRPNFPPTRQAGRALMAFAGLIAVVTFVTLVSTSHREHPREEAKEKAAEKKKEAAGGGEAPAGAPSAPAAVKGGGTVQVSEKEYSVSVAGGNELTPGNHAFDVANTGKIQHDLAVEGGGGEKKTPLIDPGKTAKLAVALKPGKYKLYCTVPGHEQLGMKAEVTVK